MNTYAAYNTKTKYSKVYLKLIHDHNLLPLEIPILIVLFIIAILSYKEL